MKTVATLLLAVLPVVLPVLGAPGAAHARPRVTRCCLVIPVADVPPRASCVQLRVPGRRIGPRLACRLIGGRPLGPGECTLAACDVP